MKSFRITFFIIALISAALLLSGCVTQQATAKVDPGISQELPPYSGPKARVSVAKFQWKAGVTRHPGAMTGLKDMLTTALVQSGRYRVLERQEFGSIKEEIALGEEGYVEESTAVKKGRVKGSDLIVVAAITGWNPGSSGTKAGLGGITKGFLGGVIGGYKKSSLAMDIRIIDTSTSEVLAATRVEGEATDVNLGALAGGLTGNVGLVGGLSTYANTPMEKAIRIAINEAAKYIVSATPREYFKY